MTGAPAPAPADAIDLIAVLAIADRRLLLADYVRRWRFAKRLSPNQAARMIGGISPSFIEAVERALYEPGDIEPRIMWPLIRLAGPLPDGLSYPEPPQSAAFPIAGGAPDGAGDDATFSCARGTAPGGPCRSPAPEGRNEDDDEDRLPILSLIDGDIAMQPFPELGTVRVMTPDEAARFATKLSEFALYARLISTKPT